MAMAEQPFEVLGLCNGSIRGNSEMLLKAALQAVQTSSSRPTRISWIHVPSVSIPRNPKPLELSNDVSQGNVAAFKEGAADPDFIPDDRRAVLDAVLAADAIIFATPVYSHQPPGFLKAVMDRILGPFADAAFVQHALARKQAGDPRFKDQHVDLRVLKPRVVAFLAVSGSSRAEHFAMALPTLHQFVYPIHAKVVDQAMISGYARAGAVAFKDCGKAVERARVLGRRLASQLGRGFDEALYLGPEPAGACPHCHLAKLDFFGGPENEIGCVTCGTKGKLVVVEEEGGKVLVPVWTDSLASCITMEGKKLHVEHLIVDGGAEAKQAASFPPGELDELKGSLLDIEIPQTPLPSQTRQRRGAEFEVPSLPPTQRWLDTFWEMTKWLRAGGLIQYHKVL